MDDMYIFRMIYVTICRFMVSKRKMIT